MPAASLKIVHNTYRDSVTLMQISAKIAAYAGVQQASVVMATEGNLALLREAGLRLGFKFRHEFVDVRQRGFDLQ